MKRLLILLLTLSCISCSTMSIKNTCQMPEGKSTSATDSEDKGCSVTLEWDQNGDADEYWIYYDYDGSGSPYEGTGADQGDSPIILSVWDLEDQSNPLYTITGLECGETVYVALKAANVYGNSSDFSEEVFTFLDEVCKAINKVLNLRF